MCSVHDFAILLYILLVLVSDTLWPVINSLLAGWSFDSGIFRNVGPWFYYRTICICYFKHCKPGRFGNISDYKSYLVIAFKHFVQYIKTYLLQFLWVFSRNLRFLLPAETCIFCSVLQPEILSFKWNGIVFIIVTYELASTANGRHEILGNQSSELIYHQPLWTRREALPDDRIHYLSLHAAREGPRNQINVMPSCGESNACASHGRCVTDTAYDLHSWGVCWAVLN